MINDCLTATSADEESFGTGFLYENVGTDFRIPKK